MDNMAYGSFLDDVIEWSDNADPKDTKRWELVVIGYLDRFGWDVKAIEDFISIGEGGFDYPIFRIEASVKSFYNYVSYCSDRMNMDRLLRCHIQYRTIKEREK